MADTTKPMRGKQARDFLAEVLGRDPDVPPALADRLAGRCMEEITQVRVRQVCLLRSGTAKAAAWNAAARAAESGPAVPPDTEAPAVSQGAVPQGAVPQSAAPPAVARFDPFAFSVLALLARHGEAGLRARLEAIEPREHLLELARAQHISLDPVLAASPSVPLAELRSAIVRGAEQRIAERRAAAG